MKVTDTIHAIRHPFRLSLGEGRYAERFVYSYLIVGKTICLVDTGVAATAPLILDTVRDLGRSPREISLILLTHAHPDHIGGCAPIKKLSPAPVAVHPTERRWAEDVELQYRERPVPNLFELVPEGVPVDRELTDGETISWEEGKTITGHRDAGPLARIGLVLLRGGRCPLLGGFHPRRGPHPDLFRSRGIAGFHRETEAAVQRQGPLLVVA